jgi:hypothetical protein
MKDHVDIEAKLKIKDSVSDKKKRKRVIQAARFESESGA